ncbi:MAG: dihydrofolate reductase [Flavobacteriaceae bacterium]|nr:dihydrofolate reductase [Flavobacteriaceae bacterium]
MFERKKKTPQIDKDQLALIEHAQQRIKQKKRLYIHFVIFLIGSLFFILFNIGLGFGNDFKILETDWFVFAILGWLFLFIYHFFNVFVTHKFMGKDWEKAQLAKLVAKQHERIEQLKQNLIKEETQIAQNEAKNRKYSNNKQNKHFELTLIVAAAENDAIGKDNQLIWHLSNDLKRFKTLTSNHHIIMGRKTFESFPKPLPNRTHIVITRQENYKAPEGVIIVNTLADALDAAKSDKQPFIIGGGEIYREAMTFADKIELTRVHHEFEADTFFPKIDMSVWKETENVLHEKDDKHNYAYSFITYERR